MKLFNCADVVPGCGASFRAGTEDEVMAHATLHARTAHDLPDEVPVELADHVRSLIRAA